MSGDVHDHLFGKEQLVKRDVDEGFPRPRVVRLLSIDPTYLTPIIERFLDDFGPPNMMLHPETPGYCRGIYSRGIKLDAF